MDEWVQRAMSRRPDVPALFGWLGLDRRGRWLIRGEPITHPRIVDVIGRNYGCDAHGRWFFQNGPQRGYLTLQYTPRIARVAGDGRVLDHTGRVIDAARGVYLDENSAAIVDSVDGAALIAGADLAWVLEHLRDDGQPVGDAALADALAVASGTATALTFTAFGARAPVYRCDAAALPATLGFVQNPQPDADATV